MAETTKDPTSTTTATKKLSFSISSKPKPSAAAPAATVVAGDSSADGGGDDSSKPQFVTVFDPTKTLAATTASALVIPPLSNTHVLYRDRKPKSLPLPSSGDGDGVGDDSTTFVLDTSGGDAPSSHISYGLTLRDKAAMPQAEDATLRRFKDDMHDAVADDPTLEVFERVPVEEFGAGMLRGMGWKDGEGIGANKSKADIKVIQYDRRAGTQGLGYNPSAADPKKSRRGEWIPGKPTDEKKLPPPPAATNGNKRDRDRGRERKEEVDKRSKNQEKARNRSSSDSEKRSKHRENERVRSSHESEKRSDGNGIRWLRSHIRVRVISRELMGGKLYLKKGEVIDVVGPTTCDISMDESRELVQGVDQEMLETALPRRGGAVLVLYGRHKGVYGNLVERNSEEEIAVVRNADTHEMINVWLEQIAEYVGDPEDLGY